MNRCSVLPLSAIQSIANYAINTSAIAVFSSFFSMSSYAQLSEPLPVQEVRPPTLATPGVRSFPANIRRATLKVLTAPEVLLDGKAERLAPGARIRNPQNLIVTPGSIAGIEVIVNIQRNGLGELQEVWLLTPLEAEQKVTANTPARHFQFGFEAAQQARKDDGKTPFKQLPTFEELGKQQRAQQQR